MSAGRRQTPSQTIGPFFAYGLTPEQYGYGHSSACGPDMADEATVGERIRIEGTIYDGEGRPVEDAMVELWQADGHGRMVTPATRGNSRFTGFGRCGTGAGQPGRFWFNTVKPGAVNAVCAPHATLIIFMRGLLVHLYTRVYFDDERAANDADEVLCALTARQRATLIATRRKGQAIYDFDIRMQGDRETVFFDL